MKRISIFTLLAFSISCQTETEQKTEVETTEEKSVAYQTLDKKVDSLFNLGIFNGFSATVVDSTGILYNKGFGYANTKEKSPYTEQTLINIASVSKVFIAVALLKAEEMNLLSLDDPIQMHLPFDVINPHYPQDFITIRQLATHTSTIIDTDVYMNTCYVNKDDAPIGDSLKEKYGSYYKNPAEDWLPLNSYLNKLLSKNGDFYNETTYANRKPGKIYEYSNIGAALCALVIEHASGKTFNEFTNMHIFQPLKMVSTAWFFEEVDSARYSTLYADSVKLPYYKILSYPDGGLITSSEDLSQFLIDLIRGYQGSGSILSASSYQTLFSAQLDKSAFANEPNKNPGYNAGIFLDLESDYNVIGHTGGDPGVNSFMFFDTKTGKGRILITNTDSQKENSMTVFYGIWNALGEY